nr:immunoglobulin light chain junction region [Macaca mulatta]
CMQTLLTPYSF